MKYLPSEVEVMVLENLILYFADVKNKKLAALGHSFFGKADCPGKAVSLCVMQDLIRNRDHLPDQSPADTLTIDLGRRFKADIDRHNPKSGIKKLIDEGANRLVYRGHHRGDDSEWSLAARWSEEARRKNLQFLLYTGPFGSEYHSFLKKHPNSESWLQRKEDGSPAAYDAQGYMLMFCPLSDYLEDYRLPEIASFVEATNCKGVFFDIPWLARGGCRCERCSQYDAGPLSKLLSSREQIVREGLIRALLWLRRRFNNLWFAANIAAPSVWDAGRYHGASPSALSGLFNELVVEWTPSNMDAIEAVRKSILHVRALAPGARISHASNYGGTESMRTALNDMCRDMNVGRWY